MGWKDISILVLLLSQATLFYLYFSNDKKIAYVDTALLLERYKGMQVAKASYEKKAVSWQANVDSLTLGIQQQIKEHERGLAGMSKKERELSTQLIRTKQQQLAQYQQVVQQKAREEDNKLTSEVLATVNAYLQEYGERKGYLVILAATQMGNIAYAEEAIDITDEVVGALNQDY